MKKLLFGIITVLTLYSAVQANVPLYLYDDFTSPIKSESIWTQYEGPGTGYVAFGNGQALMDMSIVDSHNWLTQSKIAANQLAAHITDPFMAMRFTWDMQLLDPLNDTNNDFYNGFFIGTASRSIIAGQLGNDIQSYGYKRVFLLTGMPSDGIDRGLDKYHYDLTVQGTGLNTDPTLVNLTITFKVYAYNQAYDTNPEGYQNETPLLSHTRPSALQYNTALDIKFFKYHPVNSTRDTLQSGSMTLDNFYQSLESHIVRDDEVYLYDNFENPVTSKLLWNVEQGPGTGYVAFEDGQALLDMSIVNPQNWMTKARILAKKLKPRLTDTDKNMRFTWDMQMLDPDDDTNFDYENGFSIGIDGESYEQIHAGQHGDASSFYNYKRVFVLTGMPSDDIDRGLDKYHYDLTLKETGIDPVDETLVDLTVTLKVYGYDSAYDSNPDAYSNNTPLRSYTRMLTLPYDEDLDIKFFKWNPYSTTPRDGSQCGAITIDNFYQNLESEICIDMTGDINGDCYINIEDFALFSADWLKCTDLNNIDCE
ncbi:MAG: hypothetical protein A2Y10_17420 [Planctomycetes bacterium GWF2_41_51]|nr:MAG: hypothetical protein A2Y10_17420 [Planctomycetes bacterium GWF2_41_51]HBG28007.1 hypothetical protein [Phycisphaerales bacterium]